MVKIKYHGPLGTHIVVSPRRQVKSYGLHTRGDIFEIHEADQKARPELFELFEQEKSKDEAPDPTIEDMVGSGTTTEGTTDIVLDENSPTVGETLVAEAPVKPAKPAVKRKPAKKR